MDQYLNAELETLEYNNIWVDHCSALLFGFSLVFLGTKLRQSTMMNI